MAAHFYFWIYAMKIDLRKRNVYWSWEI